MISANNLAFGLLCKQALVWKLPEYCIREIYKHGQSELQATEVYLVTEITVFSLLFAGDKMKLIFQSFLYCCLLATVAHCVEFDAKPQLKKR